MDSVTLAHKVAQENELIGLISFDYGQRHKKELDYAKSCAETLNTEHILIDISDIGRQLSGSALTDDIDVPDGHYAEDTMKITVVPNRNAIMLTIAYGIASASRGADTVATAVHGGDHFIYPDCRPAFTESFEDMQRYALEGMGEIKPVHALCQLSKADIAAEAQNLRLGIDYRKTWSCYKGGERSTAGAAAPASSAGKPFIWPRRHDPTDLCGSRTSGKEPAMYRITKEFHFSASHQLHGLAGRSPLRPVPRTQLHRGSGTGLRRAEPSRLCPRLQRTQSR